jgi:hypothetical protein
MKANDNKKPKNIAIRPSVVKIAEDKAKKLARKENLHYISFSDLIERLIYDYNAE